MPLDRTNAICPQTFNGTVCELFTLADPLKYPRMPDVLIKMFKLFVVGDNSPSVDALLK